MTTVVQLCQCGWSFTFSQDMVVTCPQCKRKVSLGGAGEGPAVVYGPSFEEMQREHWKKLHTFPLSDNWSCANRARYWQHWNDTIPNINCDCRKHWKELIEKHPPVFSSRWAFFVWSVDRHNDVNELLGKLKIPVELAVEMYGDPRVLDLSGCF